MASNDKEWDLMVAAGLSKKGVMAFGLVLAVSLGSVAAASASARNVPYPQGMVSLAPYLPLDLSIAQVRSAGFWQQGVAQGYFRFVVTSRGFEHLSNQLYIEWIEIDDAPGQARIVARVPVTALNEPGVLVFTAPVCTNGPACTTLEVKTLHTYTQQPSFVRIRLKGVGIYDIVPR